MFRFTIRDVLWLTLGVAAFLAGLLVLECGVLIVPEDYVPLGIAGWLLFMFVRWYGIALTLV